MERITRTAREIVPLHSNKRPMKCGALLPSIVPIDQQMLITLRVINSMIALLNIIGNAFLIYALKKTGQTATLSLKLVFLMTLSDFLTGVTALSLTNALLWKEFDSACQIKTATQFIHVVFGGFSFSTVFLIALDRFLHMKYLQRYSIIITKRRAYLMIISTFCFHLLSAVLFSLPALEQEIEYLKLAYFMMGIPIVITTFAFYYKAIKATTSRVSFSTTVPTQNPSVHSKKIFKAAKLITLSFGILSTPLMIVHIMLAINRHYKILNAKTITTFKWFSFIVALGNGFCSCSIFFLYNRPARTVLNNIYRKLTSHARN